MYQCHPTNGGNGLLFTPSFCTGQMGELRGAVRVIITPPPNTPSTRSQRCLHLCFLLGRSSPSELLFVGGGEQESEGSVPIPQPSFAFALPAAKAFTFGVTEPVWGFCLMFRVSVRTIHPGIGEVMGSGLHQSCYEQDSNQSSIYHPIRQYTGPPGVNVSSALMSQIS